MNLSTQRNECLSCIAVYLIKGTLNFVDKNVVLLNILQIQYMYLLHMNHYQLIFLHYYPCSKSTLPATVVVLFAINSVCIYVLAHVMLCDVMHLIYFENISEATSAYVHNTSLHTLKTR